jgi:heme A synthase
MGRVFLSSMDYRLCGLLAFMVLVIFCAWRKLRYRSWPTVQDCLNLVLGLAGMIGGITVFVVFLLTKPPAIDALSGQMLVCIGLLVPVVIFGNQGPKVWALLFPRQAPKPPQV